jgi:hypothetical protein
MNVKNASTKHNAQTALSINMKQQEKSRMVAQKETQSPLLDLIAAPDMSAAGCYLEECHLHITVPVTIMFLTLLYF